MTMRLFLRILLLIGLYGLCIAAWQAEQAMGIGRAFVYSVF